MRPHNLMGHNLMVHTHMAALDALEVDELVTVCNDLFQGYAAGQAWSRRNVGKAG